MKKMILMIITAVLLGAAPTMAETSSESRFKDSGYIGVFFPRISFRGEDAPDTGDGVGVRLGGTKANIVSFDISGFRTLHDDGSLQKAVFSGLTWDMKLSLPLFRVVLPYVSGGFGRYVLENATSVYRGNQDGSGINGYQFGAGIQFNVSRFFSLNAGYMKRRMVFDYGTPGNVEIHKQAKTFELGMAVHFE